MSNFFDDVLFKLTINPLCLLQELRSSSKHQRAATREEEVNHSKEESESLAVVECLLCLEVGQLTAVVHARARTHAHTHIHTHTHTHRICTKLGS